MSKREVADVVVFAAAGFVIALVDALTGVVRRAWERTYDDEDPSPLTMQRSNPRARG